MSYVVLDTDVASAILRRRVPGSMEARLTGQSLAITFVTVGELTSWTCWWLPAVNLSGAGFNRAGSE